MATRSREGKTFEIHNDETQSEDTTIEDPDDASDKLGEEDEERHEDNSSDTEERSGRIDSSVAENMLKFEQSVQGIRERFRLINRIGEGKSLYMSMSR